MDIKYKCYVCGSDVPKGLENHFIDEKGRILCDKCKEGKKGINKHLKDVLIKTK